MFRRGCEGVGPPWMVPGFEPLLRHRRIRAPINEETRLPAGSPARCARFWRWFMEGGCVEWVRSPGLSAHLSRGALPANHRNQGRCPLPESPSVQPPHHGDGRRTGPRPLRHEHFQPRAEPVGAHYDFGVAAEVRVDVAVYADRDSALAAQICEGGVGHPGSWFREAAEPIPKSPQGARSSLAVATIDATMNLGPEASNGSGRGRRWRSTSRTDRISMSGGCRRDRGGRFCSRATTSPRPISRLHWSCDGDGSLTCFAHETSVLNMSKMLQIRNVPEETHRLLKARAALEGVSMSLFVLREIERVVRRPSRGEVLDAIRRQPRVTLDESPAEVLRKERAAREW